LLQAWAVRITNLVALPPPRAPWALVLPILAVAGASRCLAGCSFPAEGTEAEDPPPRWPLPEAASGDQGDDSDSSSDDGAGQTAGSQSGSGEAGADLDASTSGPPAEGSSESTTDGESETSTSTGEGGSPAPYGPCDADCVAPWGCTQAGSWEACVIACPDEGCPDGGVCTGDECHAPCPCGDDGECFGEACWWPA
jgi:hypothetical protein